MNFNDLFEISYLKSVVRSLRTATTLEQLATHLRKFFLVYAVYVRVNECKQIKTTII